MGSKPVFKWSSASASIAGNVRKVNEDSCLDMPAAGLWVVADGMGGHNAGDVASRMITESLAEVRPQEYPGRFVDDVEDRLLAVNQTLYRRSVDSPEGGLCGSTVAALLAFDRYTVSLWAGDSRVYRCRGDVLEQVTTDHSEVVEHQAGRAPGAEPAQNVITRAVGGTEELFVDIELRELADGDHYLLCSDGLFKELTEAQIGHYLATLDPRAACKAMIEQAAGGACIDNVTVVTTQFRAIR
ncbi:MAG TPA: protein phosphatase 2C domain-containing protein [Steroidobacteraceae bacterium]|nr:protein phosphatase 2C domain-containing protein [Steroidobacteraceae bacterium]